MLVCTVYINLLKTAKRATTTTKKRKKKTNRVNDFRIKKTKKNQLKTDGKQEIQPSKLYQGKDKTTISLWLYRWGVGETGRERERRHSKFFVVLLVYRFCFWWPRRG